MTIHAAPHHHLCCCSMSNRLKVAWIVPPKSWRMIWSIIISSIIIGISIMTIISTTGPNSIPSSRLVYLIIRLTAPLVFLPYRPYRKYGAVGPIRCCVVVIIIIKATTTTTTVIHQCRYRISRYSSNGGRDNDPSRTKPPGARGNCSIWLWTVERGWTTTTTTTRS